MNHHQAILKDSKSKTITLDVTDPTDWNSTRLPILAPLDSALRCQICKDYYDTPVITNCSHTFCSRCIRRSLTTEQKCPVCRAAAQEIQLRRNGAVQELADAFAAARPMLVEVAKERRRGPPEAERDSRAGRVEEVGFRAATARGPRRRVTRSSSRPHSQPSSQVIQPGVEEGDDGDDYKPPLPPGMVSCPICNQHLKENKINSHIDRGCPREQSPPPSKRTKHDNSFFGSKGHQSSRPVGAPSLSEPPALRPLPKIAFGLMKEPTLRSKLHELGLPSYGTKKNLQDRYSEWLTLWNANVDSSRPRSKRELLSELYAWEAANRIPVVEKTKASGWSDQKWGNDHKDHFRDLIENARRQRPKRRAEGGDTAAEEINTGDGVGSMEATVGAESAVLPISMALPEEQFTAKGPDLADGAMVVGVQLPPDPIFDGGGPPPALIVEQSAELTMEDQNLIASYGKRRSEEMGSNTVSSGVSELP